MVQHVDVSVIVPNHNGAAHLSECIESIRAQTLKTIEIIIVDDASTDNSRDLIQEFAEVDDRIVPVLLAENSSAGVARNRGIDIARGDFLAFWDADDVFDRSALAKLHRACVADDADICVGSGRSLDMTTGMIRPQPNFLNLTLLPKELPFNPRDHGENALIFTTPAPWNKLFRTSFVTDRGLQFQAIPRSNDTFFVITALALASKITAIDHPVLTYRRGRAASLQESYDESARDFFTALTAIESKLQCEDLLDTYRMSFDSLALGVAMHALDKSKSRDSWLALARALKRDLLPALGCMERPLSDYGPALHKHYHAGRRLTDTPEGELTALIPARFTSRARLQSPSTAIPLVTLIIAAHNAEEHLPEALTHATDQTLRDIEILVVDDASEDRTAGIVEEFAKRDTRVRLIRNATRLGPGNARNAAIGQAEGVYLAFWDADDIFDRQTLQLLASQIAVDDSDMAVCGGYSLNMATGHLEAAPHFLNRPLIPANLPFAAADVSQCAFQLTNPAAWNKMFRRDLLDTTGLFPDLPRNEDLPFTYSAMAGAARISLVDRNLITYRRGVPNGEQATISIEPTSCLLALEVLRQRLDELGKASQLQASFSRLAQSVVRYNLELLAGRPEQELLRLAVSSERFRALYDPDIAELFRQPVKANAR